MHGAWKLVAGGSAVGGAKDTVAVLFGDGEAATLVGGPGTLAWQPGTHLDVIDATGSLLAV